MRNSQLAKLNRSKSSIGPLMLLVFAVILLAPILSLVYWANGQNAATRISYPLWNITKFTLLQASLSMFFSVIFGLIIAWSINHCQNRWLSRLGRLSLLLPLVMPVVTICLAWNLLLGTQGLSGWLGIRRPYGLMAILSVHVFINMALVAWMTLPAWDKAPSGYWRNAHMLNLSGWQLWRQLEWPLIKPYALRAAALSFLFCFTSFTPVFLLGGGPKYTTFETAIYAAMRTNFDPVYALILGAIQFVLCSGIIIMILHNLPKQSFLLGDQSKRHHQFTRRKSHFSKLPSFLVASIVLICIAPFLSILFTASLALLQVITGNISQTSTASFQEIPGSIISTLWVIIGAMMSSLLIGWSLAHYKVALDRNNLIRRAQLLDIIGGAVYALPALILGAGWLALISLFGLWQSSLITYVAFISIALLIGVPVVMRALVPAYEQLDSQYHKICQQLDISGWQKIRQIDWPRLKPVLIISSAYAGIMAAGDLGAFILVSQDNIQTLPILIQRQMGSYHNTVASISALMLIATQAVWLGSMAILTRRKNWQRDKEATTNQLELV